MITHPLKAPSKPITEEQLAALQMPYYVSTKEDGIRCLIHPTLGPVTSTWKPVPNHYIRSTLESLMPFSTYLDGELVVPDWGFNDIQSVVMSKQHVNQTEFKFRVFDCFHAPELKYTERLSLAQRRCERCPDTAIEYLPHFLCHTHEEISIFEQRAVSEGKEGIMLNKPDAPYKSGRSTLKEGFLLKLVRHVRDEATIIGFEEQQENCNAATLDAFGRTKRSKHAENMQGKQTLGAFICKWRGYELRVGTGEGLTESLRKDIWTLRNSYKGKQITFKYKPHGMKDVPRQPIFVGFFT